MYGIFAYIWVIFRANVGKYSIHGAYGIWVMLGMRLVGRSRSLDLPEVGCKTCQYPGIHIIIAGNAWKIQTHRIHGAGIYANIGGILMVNVTIYSIHGSYGKLIIKLITLGRFFFSASIRLWFGVDASECCLILPSCTSNGVLKSTGNVTWNGYPVPADELDDGNWSYRKAPKKMRLKTPMISDVHFSHLQPTHCQFHRAWHVPGVMTGAWDIELLPSGKSSINGGFWCAIQQSPFAYKNKKT